MGLPNASCNRSIFSNPNLTGLNKFVMYSLRTSCSYGDHSRESDDDDDGSLDSLFATVEELNDEGGGVMLENAVILDTADDLSLLLDAQLILTALVMPDLNDVRLVDNLLLSDDSAGNKVVDADLHRVLVKAPTKQRRADARVVAAISNGMRIRIEEVMELRAAP